MGVREREWGKVEGGGRERKCEGEDERGEGRGRMGGKLGSWVGMARIMKRKIEERREKS